MSNNTNSDFQLQALNTKVQQLSTQLDLILSWLVCEFGNKSNFPSGLKQLVHLGLGSEETIEEFNNECFTETETVKTARTNSHSELYGDNDHNFTMIIKPEENEPETIDELFIGPDSIDIGNDNSEFHNQNQQYQVPVAIGDGPLAEAEICGNFAPEICIPPLPVTIIIPTTKTNIRPQPRFQYIQPAPVPRPPPSPPTPREEYRCSLCPKPTVLKTLEKFQRHTAYYHPEHDPTYHKNPKHISVCPHCKKGYKGRRHMLGHLKRGCPAVTVTVTNTETQLEQYECDLCSSTFNSLNSLTTHRTRLHAGEIPYNCKFCEQIFSTIVKLKAHIEMEHSNFENKRTKSTLTPNACTFCPVILNSVDELRQHTSTFHCGFDDEEEDVKILN